MNKIWKSIIWAFMLTGVFTFCVDPYDFPFEEKENNLVVEGFITTKPGPHLITLTSTRNIYNKENQHKLYIQGAKVSVIDNEGNVAEFKEKNAGQYYSDSSFRAEVGKKYKLRIIGFRGGLYESTEEEVLAASEMHSIEVKYNEKKTVEDNGHVKSERGFNVVARVNDDPAVRNQYLLRINYTYMIYTDPAPQGCCSICWVSARFPDFTVFKDYLINGQANAEVPVAFFPIVPLHFSSRVYLEIEQYSISSAAYRFWKTLNDVKSLQGGLFDPAPAALAGNIYNVSNEDELVVGYFFASDVASKARFINRTDIPVQVYPPFYNADCRDFANSTEKQPPFWN